MSTHNNAVNLFNELVQIAPDEEHGTVLMQALGLNYPQFNAAKAYLLRNGMLLENGVTLITGQHGYYKLGSEALGTPWDDEAAYMEWLTRHALRRGLSIEQHIQIGRRAFPTFRRRLARVEHYAHNMAFEADQALHSVP